MVPTRPGNLVSPSLRVAKRLATGPPDAFGNLSVFTDAPSHNQQAIATLKRGKHVAVAVPAIFWTLDDAQELYDTVKNSGLEFSSSWNVRLNNYA
ncbi:MAG: hypothetical protein Q4C70_03355 [Planctomycetia bacterium]|nr:hypothetical protein [Planctomycetia bacterium]